METTCIKQYISLLCPINKVWWLIFDVKTHSGKHSAPNGGLEPPTLRLRVSCSTDWASQATHLSKIYFKYKSGDIHVLVPIKTPQTTIILDSGIECQCNSWKKLKLHRGCSEERWCVSIDFDLIIILACAHSIFSQLFRVSLLRPIFGHLWLATFWMTNKSLFQTLTAYTRNWTGTLVTCF